MQQERPYVLSIAGFDPSSGAGLSADIKTFEQLKVYGLAVCTGLTRQTEDEFYSVEWRKAEDVINETEMLLKKYPVKAVKFGIVPGLDFLKKVISSIKKINPEIKIVVDPVWKASAGFTLNSEHGDLTADLLKEIDLITPNLEEFDFMRGKQEKEKFLDEILSYSSLLLKGGHNTEKKGEDILYQKPNTIEIKGSVNEAWPKHGSGCVLSAAITSQLALGDDMEQACRMAKTYTEKYLRSNESLLGYHVA